MEEENNGSETGLVLSLAIFIGVMAACGVITLVLTMLGVLVL
ncbi:MAG: hypothetical protein OT477_23285 [Chloroflexi bacterium]|jgi:hypothetical protein|nr:hypothetical protein [Chloroflexota bacterium]